MGNSAHGANLFGAGTLRVPSHIKEQARSACRRAGMRGVRPATCGHGTRSVPAPFAAPPRSVGPAPNASRRLLRLMNSQEGSDSCDWTGPCRSGILS
jgi:hypothetical protein